MFDICMIITDVFDAVFGIENVWFFGYFFLHKMKNFTLFFLTIFQKKCDRNILYYFGIYHL